MRYDKKSISLREQIQQLQSRGLAITDEPAAEHHLRNISYYRLAGYWWPMQSDKVNHVFKPRSRFEDVIALYSFDSDPFRKSEMFALIMAGCGTKTCRAGRN